MQDPTPPRLPAWIEDTARMLIEGPPLDFLPVGGDPEQNGELLAFRQRLAAGVGHRPVSSVRPAAHRSEAATYMQGTTPPPSAAWLDALLRLMGSKPDGLKHQCPAHGLTGDHSRSLVIRHEDEAMLLYCHAGCTWREVFDALKMPHLFIRQAPPMEPARWHQIRLEEVRFPPPKAAAGGGMSGIGSATRNEWFGYSLVSVHPYGDPEAIAWKWRYRHESLPKRFIWKSRTERGLVRSGLNGMKEADLPLYRIRQVREHMEDGDVVVLCESESSADALWKEGVAATCGAGGAGSAPIATITEALGSYPNVLIVPDHDEAGFAFGSRVGALLPLARTKVPETPKDDARDVLTRYGADWFITAA